MRQARSSSDVVVEVWPNGRARIHLDAVQGLGEFPRAGGRAAGWGALGIEPQQLIQGASVDQLGST